MKIKSVSQINTSGMIYENLVDKSLGSSKLKLSYSDRRRSRENENLDGNCSPNFLSNLPELIRLELAASILGISVKTIYDWRYRMKQRKIPADLFVKLNRSLLIRTSILREWIASQNPWLMEREKMR